MIKKEPAKKSTAKKAVKNSEETSSGVSAENSSETSVEKKVSSVKVKTPRAAKKTGETAAKTPRKSSAKSASAEHPGSSEGAVKPASARKPRAKTKVAQEPAAVESVPVSSEGASSSTVVPVPAVPAMEKPDAASKVESLPSAPVTPAAPVQVSDTQKPDLSSIKVSPVVTESVPTKSEAVKPAVVETAPAAPKKKVVLTPQTTVKELAHLLSVSSADLIKKLMSMGVWATINQRLEPEAATLIANDFGFDVETPSAFEQEEAAVGIPKSIDDEDKLKPRAPIVTVMGHVDHGKTTLLDAIRETRVAEREAGGITQHIGAYRVKTQSRDIVFLDTPGHEAFTAMRARGAKVTDIVVLVVAADDGVRPQTVEAIHHAQAGGVKIVVAINKVDKPEANVNRVKQELSNLGLISEEWGGKTVMVEVSAKRRINLDKLIEMILLEAELMELKANPDKPGVATVVEAKKDPKKGNVAILLVNEGTLKVGDCFICGNVWGRVRAMVDEHGAKLTQAGPSTPVLALGFDSVAQAGDRLLVTKDERHAKELAARRKAEFEAIHGRQGARHLTLEDLHQKIQDGSVKEFRVVIRTDTQGSLEAIENELTKLHHDEVAIKVLHAGAGAVSLGDVLLAAASDAIILGFHVDIDPRADEEAKKQNVEVRVYSIIYELVGDVRAALEGLLAPIIKENILGTAEVRAVFKVTGAGHVAGCFVLQGKLTRGQLAHIVREGKVIHEGRIEGLKRFKDDAKEVTHGYECGVIVSSYSAMQKGDRIECFERVKELKKLTSAASA